MKITIIVDDRRQLIDIPDERLLEIAAGVRQKLNTRPFAPVWGADLLIEAEQRRLIALPARYRVEDDYCYSPADLSFLVN